MKIRAIEKRDRERILQAFKPIFAGWDYLSDVIDAWFESSSDLVTMVACAENDEFIAMMQVQEFAPKRWFSRGLRANPKADSILVGKAIYALRRKLENLIIDRGALSVSYRTLETFFESVNLAGKFGFKKKFSFAHKWYDVATPEISVVEHELDFSYDFDLEIFFKFLHENTAFMRVDGYFFTWWEIRPLTLTDIQYARDKKLAFVRKTGNEIAGAGLLYHVPEIKYLFISIAEGDDAFITDAFKFGMKQAQKLGCVKIGLIHPEASELTRRQELLKLETGCVHSILFHKDYRSEA